MITQLSVILRLKRHTQMHLHSVVLMQRGNFTLTSFSLQLQVLPEYSFSLNTRLQESHPFHENMCQNIVRNSIP
jgi:hypothetical protein